MQPKQVAEWGQEVTLSHKSPYPLPLMLLLARIVIITPGGKSKMTVLIWLPF